MLSRGSDGAVWTAEYGESPPVPAVRRRGRATVETLGASAGGIRSRGQPPRRERSAGAGRRPTLGDTTHHRSLAGALGAVRREADDRPSLSAADRCTLSPAFAALAALLLVAFVGVNFAFFESAETGRVG